MAKLLKIIIQCDCGKEVVTDRGFYVNGFDCKTCGSHHAKVTTSYICECDPNHVQFVEIYKDKFFDE